MSATGPPSSGEIGSARNAAGRRWRIIFELFGQLELPPEIVRDRRRRPPRRGQDLFDEARAARREILGAAAASSAASCASRTCSSSAPSDRSAFISAATRRGSRDVVQNAAAVHRGRHRGRRIGQDRHALVERLDERHAEPFVLARAEKQIGES